MYCQHCGKGNPPEAKFCACCGKELIQPPITQADKTNVDAQTPVVANKPSRTKKKSKKWIFGFVAAIVVLVGAVFFARSCVEEKRIDELSAVKLQNFAVTREQYDVIDPTLVMRYGLNGTLDGETLTSLGFHQEEDSTPDALKYSAPFSSGALKEVRVTLDASYNLVQMKCAYRDKFTSDEFGDLTSTLEKLSGTFLEWFNGEENCTTQELSKGTESLCIVDSSPRFIRLYVDQYGYPEVTYKFSDGDTYTNTVLEFIHVRLWDYADSILYCKEQFADGILSPDEFVETIASQADTFYQICQISLEAHDRNFYSNLAPISGSLTESGTDMSELLGSVVSATTEAQNGLEQKRQELINVSVEMSSMDVSSSEFVEKAAEFDEIVSTMLIFGGTSWEDA